MGLAVAILIHIATLLNPYFKKEEISTQRPDTPVMHAEKLCKEAARMGFDRIILPKRNLGRVKDVPGGLQLVGVTTVKEAMEASQKGKNNG